MEVGKEVTARPSAGDGVECYAVLVTQLIIPDLVQAHRWSDEWLLVRLPQTHD